MAGPSECAATTEIEEADRHELGPSTIASAGRGAPELVACFSREDLDDRGVTGGSFDKTYLGLNWWATRRWQAGFGWGRTRLDRFATTGTTDSFLTRLQWVY